jgi:hypothetical protein
MELHMIEAAMASASKRQSKPTPAATKLRGGKRLIALTLDPELIEELDAIAAEDERPRARMIERLLREAVETYKRSRKSA